MKIELPNIPGADRDVIPRRQVARILFGGLAVGMMPPGLLAVLNSRKHLFNSDFLSSADDALAAKAYQPAFLTGAQLSSLVILSEAIIPGSSKARSAEFIDLLLSVDNAGQQQEFVGSLDAMDATSQKMFHKNVTGLDPQERQQLLEAESAKDSGAGSPFGTLKSWTITAYYSSEIGLRELGWTPDRVFPSFPGCTHAESHS